MLFLICLLMTLLSSSLLVFAEGIEKSLETSLVLDFAIIVLSVCSNIFCLKLFIGSPEV